MFPYLTDEKFYFASDGHLGLGGLDIFESDMGKKGFGAPKNLGPILNGRTDDFGFIINEKTNRGYFSSNRDGGFGDDDIYSFERIAKKCEQTVGGTVFRKANDNPVANAQVILKTKENMVVETSTTNSFGAFSLNSILDCEETYSIEVKKEGYEPISKEFVTTAEPNLVNTLPMIMTKELNKLIKTG